MKTRPQSSPSSSHTRVQQWPLKTLAAVIAFVLLASGGMQAQDLSKDCTATIQNRSVQINADGTFAIPNIPVDTGKFRLRVICKMPDGTTRGGQSDFITFVPNGYNAIPRITLGQLDPLPTRIELVALRSTLTTKGETTQLNAKAILPSGSVRDITSPAAGVTYASSNNAIATVSPEGVVTAVKRGQAILSARFEGLIASAAVNVAVPNDADGDGMPDEWERANGLNPNDASDANQDLDGDGLTNLQEYQLGTNPRAADTDGDGLKDGEEVRLGTNPLKADSDGDGLRDGEEVRLGTNPLNPDTDGDGIRDGDEVALGLNPRVATPTTTLQGRIVDQTGQPLDGASALVLNRFAANANSTGFFVIRNVPASMGNLVVLGRAVRAGQVLDGVSASTPPVAGDITDAGTIQVGVSSGVVTGLVLSPTNAPVVGAQVSLRNNTDARSTSTDATGRYRVTGMRAGTILVSVSDARTGLRGQSSGQLVNGQSATINVMLAPSGTIAGVVRRRDRVTPVGSGVNVRISGSVVADTTTNALGKYSFDFVPLGSFTVTASDSDSNKGETSGIITNTGQTFVANITFLGRGSVSGRVLDGASNPVPNAAVVLNTSGSFSQAKNTTTDANGHYEFSNIFIGSFTISASSPITRLAGGASGSIAREGDAATADVMLAASGSIAGNVFRANTTTGVPGVQITIFPSGLTATTNNSGQYRVDLVPIGNYSVEASDPATGDRGRATAAVNSQDQVQSADVTLNGQGRVLVTVVDGGNTVVPGAQVTVTATGTFSSSAQGATQADGTVLFERVLAGTFQVDANNPANQLAGSRTSTVAVGATANVTVQLQGAGSLVGNVFLPDGQTPAPSVTISLDSARSVRTDTNGAYRFDTVPTGQHSIGVYDAGGNLRASAGNITISTNAQQVRRNVTLIGLATVSGHVTNADASSAGNVSVSLRSLAPSFGHDFGSTTDVAGNYSIAGVPVGAFQVSASSRTQTTQSFGSANGNVTTDGQTVVANIQLSSSVVPATTTLYDGNGFTYNLRENGSLQDGQNAVFQGDGADNRGAMQLEIVAGSTAAKFNGQTFGTVDMDGRQITLSQSGLNGIDVARKIFVPASGYFARYVEVLSNPGTTDVTVNVRVTSDYRYITKTQNTFRFQREPRVVGTSSGDSQVIVGGLNADKWALIDDDEDGDPFLRNELPTVAHVFDGGGTVSTGDGSFNLAAGFGALSYTWQNITVPAGGTVELMHFVSQQTGRASAQATAERLLLLPAEATAGLSASDTAAIKNFSVPADLSTTATVLPRLNTGVRGRVLAADSTTLIPYALTKVRSNNPLYGRTYSVYSDGDGFYSVASTPGSSTIPAETFTVSAQDYYSAAVSPTITGSFPTEPIDATQDVIFSNTGILNGLVRRGNGNVVSLGSVKVSGTDIPQPLLHTLAADGTFHFVNLPVGTYDVQGLVSGTALAGNIAATITAGQSTDATVVIQSAGGVQGTVRRLNSTVATALNVTLRGPSNIYMQQATDTAGHFFFAELPTGTYLLETFEQASNTAASASVSVTQDQISTSDLLLKSGGSVAGTVYKSGGVAPGAQITLTHTGGTLSAIADTQGHFQIDNVQPGAYSIRAVDPISGFRGIAAGTLGLSGNVVQTAIQLYAAGSINGHVFQSDGVTPVPNVPVSIGLYLYGFPNTINTDANGAYSFELVPLGNFQVRVDNPANGDRGLATANISVNNEARTVDVRFNGLGTVAITVQDASNNLIPNANVNLQTQGNFYNSITGITNANGVVTLPNVFAGTFSVNATDPATLLAGSGAGSVIAGGTTTLTVHLQPAGTILGRVFDVDGTTPAVNSTVRLSTTYSVLRSVVTDDQGNFRFNAIPLGSYIVDASDDQSRLRARQSGLALSANGEVVTRNLVFTGLGVVNGTVRTADSTPQAGVQVSLRSLNPAAGGFFSGQTDANGFYSIPSVPVGGFSASVFDFSRGLAGNTSGRITDNGQTVTADINLTSSLVNLPQVLSDANRFTYDIYGDGEMSDGTRDAYDGAFLLYLTPSTNVQERFTGNNVGTAEDAGREIALRQSAIAGLNVTRKVFVPTNGYFARYLEILENPGVDPVTVNVKVDSNLGSDGSTRIVATSTGDNVLNTSDFWLATDDDNGSSPYPNSDPSLSEVFGGPNARTTMGAITLNSDQLTYNWNAVTVPAGQSVILMHFAVQQSSQAGSVASAQRLVQLPPEALQGLGPEEIPNIVNFAVPADGVSTLAALDPPPDGAISGRVLAGDGITPIPNSQVTYRSGNVIFGRAVTATSDQSGSYNMPSVPVDGFALQARHPQTSVMSPQINSNFLVGETTTTRDVVFSNTGQIAVSVTRADGSAAPAPAYFQVSGPAYSQSYADSTNNYVFTGLLPGTYSTRADVNNPQGTGLFATMNVDVAVTQTATSALLLPAVGAMTGTVSTASGAAASNVFIRVYNNQIYRQDVTNLTGGYTFADLLPGTYTFEAFEPNSSVPTSSQVTIVAGQTLTQNVTLIAVGSVRVHAVTFTGANFAGGYVYIQESSRGSFFRYAGTTDSTGLATITNVTSGTFVVKVTNPANQTIEGRSNGTLTSNGELVDATVTMPATGTAHGHVTLANGSVSVSGQVQISTAYNGVLETVVTNATGDYTFTAPIQLGVAFSVTAFNPNNGNSRRTVSNLQIASDGQSLTVDVVLPALANVRVTVRHADGTPHTSAYLYRTDSVFNQAYAGSTDSNGQLLISGVPEGAFSIRAVDQNTGSTAGAVSGNVLASNDGQTIDVTINSPLAGNINGSVFGADGSTKISYAYVDLVDVTTGNGIASSRANFNGDFSFSNVLDTGQGFRVVAHKPSDYSSTASATGAFTSDGQTITINVTLPISTVTGTVTYFDGTTPVAYPEMFMDITDSAGNVIGTRFDNSSNADGTFSFIDVPVGTFVIHANDGNFGLNGTANGTVTDLAVPVVVNVRTGPAGTVTGTITDASGNPISAQVFVSSSNGSFERNVFSDINGVYSISTIAVGNISVVAKSGTLSGAGIGSLVNNGDTITVNVQLPGVGTVTGHLFDVDGTTPIANATVRLRDYTFSNGSTIASAATDANGLYSVANVPAAPFRAEVMPSTGFLAAVAEASAVAQQSTTVDLRFGTGVRLGFNLDGSDNFRYDVLCDGDLNDGGTVDRSQSDAYDGAYYLTVGSFNLPCFSVAPVELSGRQLVLGPARAGAVTMKRKIYVPTTGGFARYQEILTNPGTQATTVTVSVNSNLGSDSSTILVVNPATNGYRYAVTNDGCTSCDPALAHVFGGTGARVATGFQLDRDNMTYTWTVVVPAGQTVSLMHFAVQRNNSEPATAEPAAIALSNLTDPHALDGMTAAEKAQVLNFNIP